MCVREIQIIGIPVLCSTSRVQPGRRRGIDARENITDSVLKLGPRDGDIQAPPRDDMSNCSIVSKARWPLVLKFIRCRTGILRSPRLLQSRSSTRFSHSS